MVNKPPKTHTRKGHRRQPAREAAGGRFALQLQMCLYRISKHMVDTHSRHTWASVMIPPEPAGQVESGYCPGSQTGICADEEASCGSGRPEGSYTKIQSWHFPGNCPHRRTGPWPSPAPRHWPWQGPLAPAKLIVPLFGHTHVFCKPMRHPINLPRDGAAAKKTAGCCQRWPSG